MSGIEAVRRRFRVALVSLLAICFATAGILLSPIGSSPRARQQQIEQLRAELRAKTLENAPLRQIDRQVIGAQQEIAAFYRDRLPSSYALISERLGAIASATGVTLAAGHYKSEASGVPGLEHVVIEASISSNYLQAVKFINAVEREKTFFLIDGVALTQQQQGIVQLQIRIEAFLNEG